MSNYEYGRIIVLASKLAEAGVPQDIMDKIMAGGESIRMTSSSEKKAEWMSAALHVPVLY